MSGVDKAKNKAQDLRGKAKEAVGKVTGDKSTENEGKGDQAKSNLKDAGEEGQGRLQKVGVTGPSSKRPPKYGGRSAIDAGRLIPFSHFALAGEEARGTGGSSFPRMSLIPV